MTEKLDKRKTSNSQNNPEMSDYFKSKKPPAIRLASTVSAKRKDGTKKIDLSIGNVSLPMHPAMIERKDRLNEAFPDGVVKYTPTAGTPECTTAFKNIVASSGFDTSGLYVQVTNGGSQAMRLLIAGVCGNPCEQKRPLLLIEPAYTNYMEIAEEMGRKTVSVNRHLKDDGYFALPDLKDMDNIIKKHRPGALLVITYDNPTGQKFTHEMLVDFAMLCVKYNIWFVTDEAYREMDYTGGKVSSIWGITNKEVPGIEGRRISIESVSKVFNGCGLRIGALVTDNKAFHEAAVAAQTPELCAGTINQYIVGALAAENHADLKKWYDRQRTYYKPMLTDFITEMKDLLPGIIISSPDVAIYSVIDVRRIAKPGFDAEAFVLYCAREGKVKTDDGYYTLLVSPMAGFYTNGNGKTQMRVAYVESAEAMKKAPVLFAELFKQYEATR
jgi:aspartate aminotransferase